MPEQKEYLREQARKHRALIDFRDEPIEDAAYHFFDILRPKADKVIAGYWPNGREFDPTGILEQALEAGITCALPVVTKGSRVLSFRAWSKKTQLLKGSFGIMEPQSEEVLIPDIMLVPLLAFDRRGYRLGQGGGYYDATLESLRKKKKIEAIGVAYGSQAVLFNLPVEEHDQRMDWILTPQGLRDFRD